MATVPLPLRALLRRPLTRVAYALTGRAAWWTPDFADLSRAWNMETLAAARTPDAVRDLVRAAPAAAPVPDYRLHTFQRLAGEAGCLSRALVRWCVEVPLEISGIGRVGLIYRAQALRRNPALTDALARVAQASLEESLWRDVMRARLRAIVDWDLASLTDLGLMRCCEPMIAWVHLHRPSTPPRVWPRFVRRALRHQLHDDRLRVPLAGLPDVPPSLLQTLQDLVWRLPSSLGAPVLDQLLRRTPCPVDFAMLRAQLALYGQDGRLQDIQVYFAVLPPAAQRAVWSAVYRAEPSVAVRLLAQAAGADGPAGRPWPGLTMDHLAHLLTHPDAPVRLAAVQLMAQIAPGAPSASGDPLPTPEAAPSQHPAPGPCLPHPPVRPMVAGGHR